VSKPEQAAPPDAKTIAAEALCALTGLTDRRHRQIAKAGYFPPPIRGQYQLTATLQGMFRYYRELRERGAAKREAIDDEKHRKLKLQNDKLAGLLTDTSVLAAELQQALTPIRNELQQKFENELPLSMSSMGVAENRIVGKRLLDDLFVRLQTIFKKWEV
jgi:hypothetical protein